MSKTVKVSRNSGVFEIILDRPKANAIDANTSEELYHAFDDFRKDEQARVAIITGQGERFFSAGWDLKAASEGEAVDADHGGGGFAGLTEFFDLNKPVIAAVNGLAVGGGFELALACDLIVCADHAEFFLPETTIGIVADSGGVLRLPKRLPKAIANYLLLTGNRLGAKEALRFGLVNCVTTSDQLMNEARRIAQEVCQSAPLAIQATKAILNKTTQLDVEEGFRLMRSGEIPEYQKMLTSEDSLEGSTAFAQGREPVWRGQ